MIPSNRSKRRLGAWLLGLALSSLALGCSSPQPAAPPLQHDLSGVWAGPPLPTLQDPPPLTPEGQTLYDANRPTWGPKAVGLADSNDPLVTCDPLGFPRSMLYETRGFEFVHTPAKTIQLLQYQRVWREIWTDGRPLPSDVGGTNATSPDPRWYGYSVGKWIDDSTFVVQSTGSDERSWLEYFGHPHSLAAPFEERYHRLDKDNLEVTMTVTDPQVYTRPFVAMKQKFVRSNKQELEEQMCVPSEALEYFKTIATPAALGNR